MTRLGLAIALTLGCGAGGRQAPRPIGEETPPAAANPACADGRDRRLTLALRPDGPITTPAGLEVTLVRRELETYRDGAYEQWVELRFRDGDSVETRRFSLYATRRPEVVLDVCVMLGERREDAVELLVLPRAERPR